jgi:hypothetical protein
VEQFISRPCAAALVWSGEDGEHKSDEGDAFSEEKNQFPPKRAQGGEIENVSPT